MRFASVLALGAVLVSGPLRAEESMIGREARELRSRGWANSEDEVSFAAFRGRPVLAVFWGIGCRTCVCAALLKKAESLHARHAKQGLAVIGPHIQDSNAAQLDAYGLRNGITFPVGQVDFDPEWGFSQVPRAFLVDPSGRVVWEGADLEGGFQAALARSLRSVDWFGEASLPPALSRIRKTVAQRQFGKAIQDLMDFACDPEKPDDLRDAARQFQRKLESMGENEYVRATSDIRMGLAARGVARLERAAAEFRDQPAGRQAQSRLKELKEEAQVQEALAADAFYSKIRNALSRGAEREAAAAAGSLFRKYPDSTASKLARSVLESYEKLE